MIVNINPLLIEIDFLLLFIMKRYLVEEQNGIYRVFFVNLVTNGVEYLKETFFNQEDAQAFCDELNAYADEQ